jgi:hypothetical protein
MKKVIRLTERELTRLIKNIVLEEKRKKFIYEGELSRKGEKQDIGMEMYEEDDFEEIDFEETEIDNEMTKQDAIEKIAEFLKTEVLPKMSPAEKRTLKQKVHSNNRPMGLDEDDDLESRRASRREKGLMRGGLALAGSSAVAALGEFMGYSEFDLTNMIHDINHMAGLENYTGPVTVGMVATGLAMALKGLDMRMRRTGE